MVGSESRTHLVMEATRVYWKPVWHILGDGDFTLLLANLLAHGLIRGIFVPDAQAQEMRGLFRTRK